MGSSVAGQMKRMLPKVTEHAHSRIQFGKPLWEFGLIQEKIFNMVMKTYAMESMAYLTAGHMDKRGKDGEIEECSLEAAMVKVGPLCVYWYIIIVKEPLPRLFWTSFFLDL